MKAGKQKILIVKNIGREGPGLLAEVLTEKKIPFIIADLEAGDALPSPDEYAAVVVLGGPDSANDKSQKIIEEIDFISRIHEQNIPYLGICLGMQLMVKALDGEVIPCHTKETGFTNPAGKPREVMVNAKGHPLFRGLPGVLPVFQLHGETVALPETVEVLGSGQNCRPQIIQYGRSIGIQGHFELTGEMLQQWLAEDPDLLATDSKKIMADYQRIKDSYRATGRQLMENFIGWALS